MAAAYAALVSVMHIIDNLHLHPHPPISLHKKQAKSLVEKVTFLLEFLEGYNRHLGYSTEADPLESRIADAAYAAEDVIESFIVDQITNHGKKISLGGLYRALKMVIKDMALIEKEAMEIKAAVGIQHHLHRTSTPSDSLRSSSIAQKSGMVGADDVLLQMKDKLTSHCRDLQIIPIVGMGGSGKTTLAITVYQDRLIKEHFYICAWATISQEYSILEILRQLNNEFGQHLNEDELGVMLYKHLFDRKYLIIMDDMWSIDAWDRVRNYFPDNKNGSRIVITTRLSNLATEVSNSNSLEMKLLEEDNSWELLSRTVFGGKGCPLELEEIGKKIGKSCKGLPLSIVVVGGLLAKSKHTREFWEYVENNLNRIVNLEDDERCLKILHMSYSQLPLYLKPCFLYMGVFPEDDVIRISRLVKLWVAEGFLKPVTGKSLEEIARVYLKDLIHRNLVLIKETGRAGSMKYCKIHDLLRDLCLREAKKERFYTTTLQGIVNVQRRIIVSKDEDIKVLSSVSLTRSLMWNLGDKQVVPAALSLRLLRILDSWGISTPYATLPRNQLVNLRLLALPGCSVSLPKMLFWNLQTLILRHSYHIVMPLDIWCMPRIRHVKFSALCLPDPRNRQDDTVLENLQTLGRIRNFKYSEEVAKRIPNIRKLKTYYDVAILDDRYCLSNLDCLDKLESFTCEFYDQINQSLLRLIKFPQSLKKLSLTCSKPTGCWQEILDKIGVLPHLEKLALQMGSFKELPWETTEGQFRSLKFLHICFCEGLQVWTIKSSHFPCLEKLALFYLKELKEIPLDFAEISTLKEITLGRCRESVLVSAKKILEEQEALYGEADLQVTVMGETNAGRESLACPNIRFQQFNFKCVGS